MTTLREEVGHKRVLDPDERVAEVLFGLIMSLIEMTVSSLPIVAVADVSRSVAPTTLDGITANISPGYAA